MNLYNKVIYICVAAYFEYISCTDIIENDSDVIKNKPTRLKDGDRSFNIEAINDELSNCTCVDHQLCRKVPKQTATMIQQCSSTGNICCLTDDIEGSALMNLLLGPLNTLKTASEVDTSDNCACFTEGDCIEHQGTVSVFGPNSPTCPDSSHICCLLSLSETDLLAELFNVNEPSPNTSDTSEKCRCVPEQRCTQELSLTVNVSACDEALAVCCPEKYIEEIVPSTEKHCECVPLDQCPKNLSRITQGVDACHPSMICCGEASMIDNTTAVDKVEELEEECRCVALTDCLHQPAVIDVRRHNPITDCESVQEVCCPVSKIRKETPLVIKTGMINEEAACTCVESSRCKSTGEHLALMVDLRIKTCNDPSSVCCFTENILIPERISQPDCICIAQDLCADETMPSKKATIEARCVGTEICCMNPKEFHHSLSCGQSHESNARIDVRISLGHQANYAEFPWMVAIFEIDSNGKQSFKCGGSLIHPRIVLTTAHCIHSNSGNLLMVRAGEWNIESVLEEMPHVEKYVISKIMHPQYSARSLEHNIGLLYLETGIRLQHHINTICLPVAENFTRYDPFCTATGWGTSEFGNSELYQTTLKKVDLPIVDADRCQESLRQTRLGANFTLDTTAICAGGTREDTCTGDGGSPLVCLMKDDSNRYVQVGAVAWGIGCGDLGLPGVYASTFPAVDWIRQVVAADFGEAAVKYFT